MNNNTRASLKSRLEEGTLVVCIDGRFTRESMKDLRDETFRWVVTTETKRLLCDLKGADIALSESEWRACADEQASVHALAIPTALLVPRQAIGHAWRFSDRLNASGRACVAFSSPDDAYLWANVVLPRPRPSRETRRATGARAPGQSPAAPL